MPNIGGSHENRKRLMTSVVHSILLNLRFAPYFCKESAARNCPTIVSQSRHNDMTWRLQKSSFLSYLFLCIHYINSNNSYKPHHRIFLLSPSYCAMLNILHLTRSSTNCIDPVEFLTNFHLSFLKINFHEMAGRQKNRKLVSALHPYTIMQS